MNPVTTQLLRRTLIKSSLRGALFTMRQSLNYLTLRGAFYASWQSLLKIAFPQGDFRMFHSGRARARNDSIVNIRSFFSLLIVAVCISGCALEPWVKPYEREMLADPLMSFSRDPLSDQYRQHVYDVREGARGAGVSQGGGCGCN